MSEPRTVLLLDGGTNVYVLEDAEQVGELLRADAMWIALTDVAGRDVTVRSVCVQAFHPQQRQSPGPGKLPDESVRHLHDRFQSAA